MVMGALDTRKQCLRSPDNGTEFYTQKGYLQSFIMKWLYRNIRRYEKQMILIFLESKRKNRLEAMDLYCQTSVSRCYALFSWAPMKDHLGGMGHEKEPERERRCNHC